MNLDIYKLALSSIRRDGGTQPRAVINDYVVDEYVEVIENGTEMPPVVTFFDGTDYWLADGFHRIAAYEKVGRTHIQVEVHLGSLRDAKLYSLSANATHGLPRSNTDKRNAVHQMLEDAEWSQWADAEIARRCAVSDRLVNKVRAELSSNGSMMPTQRKVIRGGQQYTLQTHTIGAKPRVTDEVRELLRHSDIIENKTELDFFSTLKPQDQAELAIICAEHPGTQTVNEARRIRCQRQKAAATEVDATDDDNEDSRNAAYEIWKTCESQIWQCGRHILGVGDCTDTEFVNRVRGDARGQLALTDPPYGLGYEGKTKDKHKIANDDLTPEKLKALLLKSFQLMFDAMEPGATFYCWHADTRRLIFESAMTEVGLPLKSSLVWEKNIATFGRSDFHWKHENCLRSWKPGAGHSWYSDNKQTTILKFDKPARSVEHSTKKPLALIEYLITCSSQPGDTVLDYFLGSGTTMEACERLGRKCIGFELDVKYAAGILSRMEKAGVQPRVISS